MDTVNKILNIFLEKEKKINESITKRELMDKIKSFGLDVIEIRNAWHFLIGNRILIQNGDEIFITELGFDLLNQTKN